MQKVIAVDFHDTVVNRVEKRIELMKPLYDIELTMDDFVSERPFHCRGWGGPTEADRKLQAMKALNPIYVPCQGLVPAFHQLHERGYKIHIITAGSTPRSQIETWLANLGITVGPGKIIEDIHLTRVPAYHAPIEPQDEITSLADAVKEEKEEDARKIQLIAERAKMESISLKKIEVIKSIGAFVMIDDSAQLFKRVIKDTDCQCLLFGDYKWNQIDVDFSHPHDYMTWEQRNAAGIDFAHSPFPFEGHERLHRVKGWDEILKWIDRWESAGEVPDIRQ